MKTTFTLVSLLFTSFLAAGEIASPADDALSTVLAVVKAFNQHDAPALAALLEPEVKWWAVGPQGCVPEGEGRAEIEEGMRSYFKSVPDVTSEIMQSTVIGNYVLIEERVTWDGRSQRAVGVYEIKGRLVRNAWYFPAMAEDAPRAGDPLPQIMLESLSTTASVEREDEFSGREYERSERRVVRKRYYEAATPAGPFYLVFHLDLQGNVADIDTFEE